MRPGRTLAKAEVARVEKAVEGHAGPRHVADALRQHAAGRAAVVLRQPDRGGAPKKVKTLLHADGEALRQGIEERPTVATPNQQEAERLLGRTLLTRTHYLEAAERIRTMGPESVVLSLGSRGAVGAFREGIYRSPAAARGCGLSDRRGRRAVGGVYVGHGAQEQSAWKRCAGASRRARRRRACPA